MAINPHIQPHEFNVPKDSLKYIQEPQDKFVDFVSQTINAKVPVNEQSYKDLNRLVRLDLNEVTIYAPSMKINASPEELIEFLIGITQGDTELTKEIINYLSQTVFSDIQTELMKNDDAVLSKVLGGYDIINSISYNPRTKEVKIVREIVYKAMDVTDVEDPNKTSYLKAKITIRASRDDLVNHDYGKIDAKIVTTEELSSVSKVKNLSYKTLNPDDRRSLFR